MNKKASNAWHELKWFYRFSVLLISLVLVYSVLYSSFNFSYTKESLGETITDKIVYSNVFKLVPGSYVYNYNFFPDENNKDSYSRLKEYFFYNNPLDEDNENILVTNYFSPIAIEFSLEPVTFGLEEGSFFNNKLFYYPSKKDFDFLSQAYFSSNEKNVAFIKKVYLINVYFEGKIYLAKLTTKTYSLKG